MNALSLYNQGLGDASQQAAIASRETKLDAAAAELAAKYATGTHTIAALWTDVDKWWRIATIYIEQSQRMPSLTSSQLRTAEDNALALLEFRAYLKTFPAGTMASRPMLDRGVALMVAPIRWVRDIGTPVLQRSADYDDMLKAATNAPGSILSWLRDQVTKGLGLPSWFIPVVAVAAVGGLGLYAYSVLKPIGSAARLSVRRNPRRRRRARRRR